MPALPSQRVEMIPVGRITIVNPRVRNKKTFKEIVDNIAQLGLKKPITVTRRMEAGGPFYDLVCGQGRLEAYKALGQREVPALVVTADAEDCLIASLVENCARRQHRAIDLLHDIRGMQERGYASTEIARKTGLSLEYVNGVARLIEKGEQRLLRSVESGIIPVSVAVEIAEAEDHDIQAALSNAYEKGLLKGRKLFAAKKLIEVRRRRGKGLAATGGKAREQLSADALVKAYRDDTDRKRALIRRTEATKGRLLFITEALRRLSRDEQFIALLEDEDLSTMPENLGARIKPLASTRL
ncbi:plasmid partitioning protein RepB C-terminal domain-containing protein [Sphingomonas radiodurans]|uniref:plasmid partitioning protein RepB C-terminal domain-containing protein n=1 Tax=Sphingomonas radiodurans TaxID=2890321 RepID=UPI001E59CA0F|nr:plasmid partitioning protein RepB C-terminal domain-containing protein [Sphingomonas radiodurans]WBH15304.1 ParB N-terminal domain-containing protein [Sphingomonas radiodurans]